MVAPRYVPAHWEHHPKWASLTREDRARLQGFERFLRETKKFMEWTVLKYWREMRRVLAVRRRVRLEMDRWDPPGLPQLEMLYYLEEAPSEAAATNARVALKHWAVFVGGDEQKTLDRRLKHWVDHNNKNYAKRAPPVGLSTEDWKRLRSRAAEENDPPAVVVQFVLKTGMRIGDVLKIRREQLDLALRDLARGYDRMVLMVKGNKEHGFPVRPFEKYLCALLAFPGTWRTVHELLHGGGYWAAHKQVAMRLKTYATELEISGVYLHRIRHTVITEIYENKGIKDAQDLAAHESPVTTEKYIRRLKGTDQLSADLMDFYGDE